MLRIGSAILEQQVIEKIFTHLGLHAQEKWPRLSERLSPTFYWSAGGVADGAELSAAAVGACDEPIDAAGNSGRTSDFILCGQCLGWQPGEVLIGSEIA